MRLLSASEHPFSSEAYAQGFPFESFTVEAWGGVRLLKRPLPEGEGFDLAGCYPLTSLSGLDEAALKAGLQEMALAGAVSVALVADPWGAPDPDILGRAFPLARPFKTHLAYDREVGPIDYTRRRWREVRQARAALSFKTVAPGDHIDLMARLYRNLVEAKDIVGAAAFDHAFFEHLADTPGLRLVLACLGDETVGCMTFVAAGDICYAHLAGTTGVGRRHCAHYGCYAEALETFADCRVIHLGGGPGARDDPDDPILYVKRKFANVEMKSLLCGAVLDADRYQALSLGTAADETYFPTYRAPRRASAVNGDAEP